jgi:hypothetical protein
MHATLRSLLALVVPLWLAVTALAQGTPPADGPTYATIDTNLKTAGKQIRMYAFDGDPKTYFHSAQNASAGDHFTLEFDKPVAVKSISVTTGKPQGGEALEAATLEVSEDGKKFEELAKFTDGAVTVKSEGRKVLKLRIQVSADQKHPLAIREIAVESEPAVTIFKYPVEYILDVSDAPEMKEWGEKVIKVCERAYQWINEELKSDGYKPPTVVTMALKKDYKGVAAAGGGKITGSVSYFKGKPNDIGAMVHETVHIVQQYRVKGNPGWLVEGIADYIRFFKYEPGKIGKLKQNPNYNDSYRTTAAFLAFVTDKYDKELVRKLNKRMREGEYREEIWKEITGKMVKELNEEWRASVKAAPLEPGLTAGPAWPPVAGPWPSFARQRPGRV